VASLIQRGWFQTVVDDQNLSPDLHNRHSPSQFQRICQYVAHVNNALLDSCQQHVRLEDLVTSPQAFQVFLASSGILTSPPSPLELETKIDPSIATPNFSSEEEKYFERILGPMLARLGYSLGGEVDRPLPLHVATPQRLSSFDRADTGTFFDSVSRRTIPLKIDPRKFTRVGIEESGWVESAFNDKHTHIILGGSTWTMTNTEAGWPASHDSEYVCQVDVDFDSSFPVTLMLLEYNQEQMALRPRRLLRLRGRSQHVMFRCLAEAHSFDVAVYASAGAQRLVITACRLSRFPGGFLPASPLLLTPNED